MALINRVSRLFKADIHAVLDQIEEPEVLLKQAIRDMEDDLAATERRIALGNHDQESMIARADELEARLVDVAEELDLCFASGKDDLARSLVRKKLEAERTQKQLRSKIARNTKFLSEQGKTLEENRATLNGLRQKAELIASRAPARSGDSNGFDSSGLVSGENPIGEDEIEVAFLREKSKRSGS